MRINEHSDPNETKMVTATFLAVLKYRDMSLDELGRKINVSPRTLQGYTSGRNDLRNARAIIVWRMAQALRVPPEVLLGLKPLQEVFDNDMPDNPAKIRKLPSARLHE